MMTNTETLLRAEQIEGLRQLATFLEAHPEIPISYQTYNVYFEDKDDLRKAARIGSWAKEYYGDYFVLRKIFAGHIQLDVYTDREKVCRPVVVGTRIVEARPATPEQTEDVIEWVCESESLLAGDMA